MIKTVACLCVAAFGFNYLALFIKLYKYDYLSKNIHFEM